MSNKSEEFEGDNLLNNIERFTYILVPLILAVLIATYFTFFHDGEMSQDSFAQFGDYFGGILNPLLSFLAVLLLLFSIRLQSKELSATRKELEETKDIHSDNVKLQESLFALQVITTEIKEVDFRISKVMKLTTEMNYGVGPKVKRHLNKAYALTESDFQLISEMSDARLECFISEFNYVLSSACDELRQVGRYLRYSNKKGLDYELMPVSAIKNILSVSHMLIKKSEKLKKEFSKKQFSGDLQEQFVILNDDSEQLKIVFDTVALALNSEKKKTAD